MPSSRTKWHSVGGNNKLVSMLLLAGGLLLMGCYVSATPGEVLDDGKLLENNKFAEYMMFDTSKLDEVRKSTNFTKDINC